MAKSKQKASNKSVRSSPNDVSTLDHNNTLPPSATTTDNSVVNTASVIVNDKIDDEVYTGKSGVWKYATKIGLDKAKCNICQIGKYV